MGPKGGLRRPSDPGGRPDDRLWQESHNAARERITPAKAAIRSASDREWVKGKLVVEAAGVEPASQGV